jgi:ATP-binding cassette subfamily B protein
MTGSWRAIRLLATTAWRADRRLTIAVAAEPLGNTLALLAGLWLAVLTTGAIHHDTALLVLGVAGLVAGAGLGWQLDLSSSQWRMVLSEKMTRAFEIENAQLAAALPGLEHHENPEYQAKMELLRQRQGQLGDAMSTLAVAYKAVCAAVVVLVLLVLAHPLLLLLVLLALPGVAIARREQRWRQAAEDASALPGRTARYLRALAYDRDAGMEVRVFGLAGELEDRAAQAWADYRRPLERAERRVALVTFVREGLTVAGIVAAIGFELWQVINGHATPAEAILVIYVSRQVQSAVIWPIQAVGSVGHMLRTAGRFLWLRDYAASIAARYAGHQVVTPGRCEGFRPP